jgi:hypothetical protein
MTPGRTIPRLRLATSTHSLTKSPRGADLQPDQLQSIRVSQTPLSSPHALSSESAVQTVRQIPTSGPTKGGAHPPGRGICSLRRRAERPGNRRPILRAIRRARLIAPATVAISAVIATFAFAPPASATGACPNETLRSEMNSGALPDCRAYELVTPVYHEGAFPSTDFAISQDGNHLLGGSIGVFAGTESDGLGRATNVLGAAYEYSRTPTGWSAAAISPSSAQFKVNGLFDASTDHSASIWELGTLAQPEGLSDLYVERPQRTFTRIGPATPSPTLPNELFYRYLGGSSDLSRIFFASGADESSLGKEEGGPLWPYDATVKGGSTLYEYVGTGNTQPLLVGVSGARASTSLESDCGTQLGSSNTQREREAAGGSMYNAISSSGQRVFFTALACAEHPSVDTLFAREETSSSDSQTVAISEPTEAQCAECRTAHSTTTTVEKAAVFQGASEDGSKVYFTTEQELLPGATGNSLYEYDFNAPGGEKVTRVSVPISGEAAVQGVSRISEDGTHVYFVAKGVLSTAPNGFGDAATTGADNLYVYRAGRVSFVATLSPADGERHGEHLGDWAPEDNRPVQASLEGRYLVFPSHSDLTHEGTSPGGPDQVFLYDDATGLLIRASIGLDGFANDNRAPLYGDRVVTSPESGYYFSTNDSPTQADGVLAPTTGTVFFMSPDPLTPGALPDHRTLFGAPIPNVYEYRAGHVYLISDGRDSSTVNSNPGVGLIGSDATGDNVFFKTADSLIPQDTDSQQDFYDARTGGGFPVPSLASCSGDACQGPLALASSLPNSGGSATQAPETNSALVPPTVPVNARPLTKAQKLASALKACRTKRDRHRRAACERHARKTGATKARRVS